MYIRRKTMLFGLYVFFQNDDSGDCKGNRNVPSVPTEPGNGSPGNLTLLGSRTLLHHTKQHGYVQSFPSQVQILQLLGSDLTALCASFSTMKIQPVIHCHRTALRLNEITQHLLPEGINNPRY